jgi:predicted NodU family carbamoyl transferase
MTAILGISAFYHDSAASLVVGNCVLNKNLQDNKLIKSYKDKYDLD